MANIFDEFKKFSDEELKYEIALLEAVNVSNIAKTVRDKTIGKIVDTTNRLLSKVADNRIEYSGTESLKAVVGEKMSHMGKYTHEQLYDMLRDIIIAKISALVGTQALMSNDALNVAAIDEAAVLYKINENLTAYEKADIIHKKYNDSYVRQLYKMICSEDAASAKQTNEKIFEAISALPMDSRIRLKNTLCISEFSRKQIAKELRGTRGIRLMEHLIEFIGTDMFDTTKAVAFVTYESMTEFSRPERAVLAYVVWRAATFRNKGFGITDDCLPSYIVSTQREKENQREKEYMELCREHDSIKAQISQVRAERQEKQQAYNDRIQMLNDLYLKREDYKNKYEAALAANEEIKKNADTASAELNLYIDNRQNTDSKGRDRRLAEFREKLNACNRELKASNKELARLSASIREYFAKVNGLEEETKKLRENVKLLDEQADSLEKDYGAICKKYEYALEFEHYKLKTKWLTCFMDLVFEENVIRNVAKSFTHAKILNIERALTELCQAEDVLAYSKGSLKKSDSTLNYMTFVPAEGTVGMIVFTKPADSGKKAFIADITECPEWRKL